MPKVRCEDFQPIVGRIRIARGGDYVEECSSATLRILSDALPRLVRTICGNYRYLDRFGPAPISLV